MPKLTNSVPKYRKHRASGQAVVAICGRDYYLGPHGTKASKVEYDRLITEYLANGRQPLNAAASEIAVVEVCARYIKYAEGYYRKKDGTPTTTVGSVVRDLQLLTKIYGRQPAVEFGPLAIKALRQRMIDDGQARTYVNDRIARVKRMFKWAVGEQLIPPQVYQALATVPGLCQGRTDARETAPVLPVEDDLVETTLQHLPEVVADMVRYQRLTGCRPAEVCILRPCDLDRSEDVWIYQPHTHKTEHAGKQRAIPLGPLAQRILMPYLERDPKDFCFRPCDSERQRRQHRHEARRTPIAHGNRPGTNRVAHAIRVAGERYSPASYRRAIHRACDVAFPHPDLGYKLRSSFSDEQRAMLRTWQSDHRWSPNQLRHAAATEIRSQFGLEEAQVVLGHSQANVTQLYAERDHSKGKEVARRIG